MGFVIRDLGFCVPWTEPWLKLPKGAFAKQGQRQPRGMAINVPLYNVVMHSIAFMGLFTAFQTSSGFQTTYLKDLKWVLMSALGCVRVTFG